MDNTKQKLTFNQRIRLTAEDLSLLNGVSVKINTEYLKNIQQLVMYNIAEAIRGGAEEVEVDLAYLGTIIIKRRLKSTTRKNNEPSYDYEYEFKPSVTFFKDLKLAFNEGQCKLPDLFADKYGKKLLKMYESFLNE